MTGPIIKDAKGKIVIDVKVQIAHETQIAKERWEDYNSRLRQAERDKKQQELENKRSEAFKNHWMPAGEARAFSLDPFKT